MLLLKKIVNRLLKQLQISRIATDERVVYLTFDDGPEPGITEFVLDELRRYGFHATFFCRGDNAEKYPDLLQRIKDEGHAVGNHTYSHLHAFQPRSDAYVMDVERANSILQTKLLRPPYGSLRFAAWLRLHSKYQVYYWTLNSGDSDMDRYDRAKSMESQIQQTVPGAIVLYHFCIKHEHETRDLLPQYLSWLKENGYTSKSITF